MSESAIVVGGLPTLLTTLVCAAVLFTMLGRDVRWRWTGFFVLWQTFTPVRPIWLDVPLYIVALVLMEVLYGAFRRKPREVQS